MDFSLIIVSYNTANITKQCLDSVFEYCSKESFEVIVVDNASSDNSLETLEKNFSGRIRLIKNKTNEGFARANNQGAEIAQGKYLFFLNSDTILTNDVLKEIKGALSSNDKIGAIAPQLITRDGVNQIDAYGKYPKIQDIIINKFKKRIEIKDGAIDWLSGAAIVIPKRIFTEIKGWDEKFFMYFEDIDICKRIKDLGYLIVIQKNNTLIHLSGKSLKQNKKRRKYYYQSQNYYFQKHHGNMSLLILKIVRWPYKTLMTLK